ncbi:hypothetical protein WDW86_03520 [Bdellovibrionota bacterium FG-2]
MLALLLLIGVFVGIILVYKKQLALEERLNAQDRETRESEDPYNKRK